MDSRPALYPISLEVEVNKWSNNIQKQTEASSEFMCVAVATLTSNLKVDFYVYDKPNCYLGVMGSVSAETVVSTETTVRFHKSNPETYITTIFDVNFGMEESIWTPYVYETSSVQSSVGTFVECGILCDLAPECQFFANTNINCHFGNYNHTGEVINTGGTDIVKPYHQKLVFDPFYDSLYEFKSDCNNWAKFVYSMDTNSGKRECQFTCRTLSDCHFYVIIVSDCHFGNFLYNGPLVTTATSTRNVQIRQGKYILCYGAHLKAR